MIYVYSDGSSTGRVGPGGYAWIIVDNRGEIIHAGFGNGALTTNNVMELQGAICGLQHILEYQSVIDSEGVTLISDSKYVLGIADGTMKPLKNVENCMLLRTLVVMLGAKCKWVRGHSGDPINEIADYMARMGRLGKSTARNHKRVAKKAKKKAAKEAMQATQYRQLFT